MSRLKPRRLRPTPIPSGMIHEQISVGSMQAKTLQLDEADFPRFAFLG
jgi:hypothetical protein